MVRIALTLLSAFSVVLATGCGHAAGTPRLTPSSRHVPNSTPLAVLSLKGQIQQAYDSGDISALQNRIAGMNSVPGMMAELEEWSSEHVTGLRVAIVHVVRVDPNEYVLTLRFSADPRATPAYQIVRVRDRGSNSEITGNAVGVAGPSYRLASWSVTCSGHFIVYHSRYQLAGGDRAALAGLEYQRRAFEREFDVHLSPVIAYYLYPTVSLMNAMTHGECGTSADNVGCADPYTNPPSIQAAIWPTYHEPIHIYQLAFTPAPPPSRQFRYVAPLFIGEGMAVALEDRRADPRLSDYCSDLQYAPLVACPERFEVS